MGAQGLGSRAIIGSFYERLNVESGMSWVNRLAMRMSTDQESETYNWLGMSPVMREWIGGRHAKGFRTTGITIQNKIWEATLEVLVDELRRDKTGQIQVRINELAQRAVTHEASLISQLMLTGESAVAYDGQNFFDTDHAEGDNTTSQSNKITVDISALPAAVHGSTTTPSAEELQGAILQGIQKILTFNDDQNEPMNEFARQFLVMVPSAWWAAAAAATKNPLLGYGATNTLTSLAGYAIDVVPNSRLDSTWTDKFVVYRTDGVTKPFIIQEEQGVRVDALAEGSDEEFKNRRHLYGITAIRNVGFAYWQHAVQVQLV